jgi:hypothetical protein
MNTIKNSTEAPSDASREVCLEANAEETKYSYIFKSCHQNARQYHNFMITNS